MTRRNSGPTILHLRKMKGESGTNLPSLSKARVKELIEQAIVDAYGEEEQVGGFFSMIEEYLALPFRVKVLGVDAERARRSQSWTCRCQRRHRQAWNGLSLIATGAEGPGERIPVLRFPRNRSSDN